MLREERYGLCASMRSATYLHRITLWLDCNSNFYGAYRHTDKQAIGQLVMPAVK